MINFSVVSPPIRRPVRLGYFGGTFDPIHNGHREVARDAIVKLNLDKLFIVPTMPGYKDKPMFPYDQRERMAIAGFKGIDKAVVVPWEQRTYDWEEVFTYDTLKYRQEEYGKRFPNEDHEWFLIVGSDSAQSILKWKNGSDLFDMATVVEAERDDERASTHIRDYIQADALDNAKRMMPRAAGEVLEDILTNPTHRARVNL